MTEKLYYTDSHRKEFDAAVLSCAPAHGRWEVVLDKTCFFPEGGGQLSDTGTLGGAAVLDAHEREGDVVHYCGAPLPVGAAVHGVIDWAQRFARMQSHSGEHLVSGIAHRLWGCENVGFHMSPDFVTIDFDVELSPDQVRELERRANEAVWADIPLRSLWPTAEELRALDYRSKKELTGAVRLVEVGGYDLCACCAPHVKRSGEVGLIRITDCMRHRGGVRLTMLAGSAAYENAVTAGESVTAISRLTSAKPGEIVSAVERLQKELEEKKHAVACLRRDRAARLAETLALTEGNICLFEDADFDGVALRELVNACAPKCRVCAVFAGQDGAWRYAAGSRAVDMRQLTRALNAALGGRGGGGAELVQGSCTATRAEIEAYFGGL